MKRVSDPEIRKKQILDTAMKVFYEKGYDSTSLEDIAKELDVAKSLCYRYYDSKQALFAAVLDEYTKECCSDLIDIIHDSSMDMKERLQAVLGHLIKPDRSGRYHDFFHKSGNEAMHERLAFDMGRYLEPHLADELGNISDDGRKCYEAPQVLAAFLLYGMMGIWQESGTPDDIKLGKFGEIAERIIISQ